MSNMKLTLLVFCILAVQDWLIFVTIMHNAQHNEICNTVSGMVTNKELSLNPDPPPLFDTRLSNSEL